MMKTLLECRNEIMCLDGPSFQTKDHACTFIECFMFTTFWVKPYRVAYDADSNGVFILYREGDLEFEVVADQSETCDVATDFTCVVSNKTEVLGSCEGGWNEAVDFYQEVLGYDECYNKQKATHFPVGTTKKKDGWFKRLFSWRT